MAHISTIPPEIFFMITYELQHEDLLSLRLTSKTFNTRTEETHLEKLYSTRTYFTTHPDLEALLEFSEHPSNAKLRLKHLVFDISSPYIDVDEPRISTKLLKGRKQKALHAGFKKVAERKVEQYSSFSDEKEDFALICMALHNLPNLESVRIRLAVNSETISRKIIMRHYPEYAETGLAEGFLDYYSRFRRMHLNKLSNVFNYVMFGLTQSASRIKAIEFDETCQRGQWIGIEWFWNNRRHFSRFKDSFKNLKTLQLNVSSEYHVQAEDDEEEENEMIALQRAITRFIGETSPHVEELSFVVDTFSEMADSQDYWDGKYEFYTPILLLDKPFKFSNLRILQLGGIPLVEEEITRLLITHKDTLRQVSFNTCYLQSRYQVWSPIFKLLESELHLDTFEYDHIYRDEEFAIWFPKTKYIPSFRVYGDVRKPGHYCQVSKDSQTDTVRLDYRTAMALVEKLEKEIILNDSIKVDYDAMPCVEDGDESVNELPVTVPQVIGAEVIEEYLQSLDSIRVLPSTTVIFGERYSP